MHIAISEENRIVLEELKSELIQIKQEAKELSISLLIQLKTLLFQFILSYKEYSLTNIREYGLGEILMSRANRFFKLDQEDEKQKKVKKKKKTNLKVQKRNFDSHTKARNVVQTRVDNKTQSKTKSKKGVKYILKKIFKVILFPFYLLFLIFGMLLESDTDKKKSKNVKNTYNPY